MKKSFSLSEFARKFARKLAVAFAIVSALAVLFTHSTFAAPNAGGIFIVNSTSDGDVKNATLTLREAIFLSEGGTGGAGLNRTLSDGEKAQLEGTCNFAGSANNWTIASGCGYGVNDAIHFNIPNCPCTITPDDVWTNLTVPVTIDGYSEPGSSPNTAKKGSNANILITLNGSSLGGGVSGLYIDAGTTTVQGLRITGYKGYGIYLYGNGYDSIQGNWIYGNAQGGVYVDSDKNYIGSGPLATRNLIFDNGGTGIDIQHDADSNLVVGNVIGLAPDGVDPKGNGYSGVRINASKTIVTDNEIAFNHSRGVSIGEFHKSVTLNAVTQNRIHDNFDLGIDLGGDGVTANDSSDSDSGPNNLQNFPLLGKAKSAAKTIDVALYTTPNATIVVEFYSSKTCDPSGYGEGQKYLGKFVTTTSANGQMFFTAKVKRFKKGSQITALAMDANGNTSEFSKCTKAK